MVKFRCQRCSQKIAVNDEGIGVVISCPTCAENLIIPPRGNRESFAEDVDLELVREEPVRKQSWTRLFMEKLLPALLAQRRDLIQTQNEAAEQIAEIEQRVVLLQMKFQRRLAYFQERVATLEAENEVLSRQAGGRPSRPMLPFGSGRVNLRDAGFLMHS